MSFTSLFSGLSAMTDDARSPAGSHVSSSNRLRNGSKGKKMKAQGEQPGSHKKRFHQFQSKDNFMHRRKPWQNQVRESERSFPGQRCNHSSASSYNSRQTHTAQGYRTKDNFYGKKEVNPRNKKYQQRDNRRAYSMAPQQEIPKFMTQEFKEQNGLLVDGRLLCRHFLLGRCIKEAECQLEHVQGHNDMIKEICKFYIQGFCLKGDICPYMHSIPCKFFHSRRRCLQDTDCRFSHEPLNEVTAKLIEEVLNQEKVELGNRNKEESSEQQANTEENKATEESKAAEENKNLDFLTQPLRPNFYNSTDGEKEPHGHPFVTEQSVLDTDQPTSSPPSNQEEPVCYSVEAMLGPQMSKNFSSFSKIPVSQDSSSVSDPHPSSDGPYANQSEVPYSVEAVLSSYRFADNSSKGKTPDPPNEQIALCVPQVISEEFKAPPLGKVEPPPMRIMESRPQQATAKSLFSLEEKNCLISNSENEGQTTYTKQELFCPPEKSSISREIEHTLQEAKPLEISAGQTCTQKHPSQLKPNLSKGRFAVPDESATTCKERRDVAVHRFPFSKPLPNPKQKRLHARTGALQRHSSNASNKSCVEAENPGVFSAENSKRPFSSLFASPLTDTVALGSNSLTAVLKPQQSEDVRIPSSSFSSLFASPLCENPPSFPCLKTQTEESAGPPSRHQGTENLASNSEQKDSDGRFFQSMATTSHRQTFSQSSHNSTTKNDAGKQPSSSVGSIVSGSPCDLSTSRTNQKLPDVSSPRAPSVLKSLFVPLGPYTEDG